MQEAKKFFKTLFPEGKGYIELRIFQGNDIEEYFYRRNDIDRLITHLSGNVFKGNIYFGVCPRSKLEGRFGGKEENVKQVNCLWVDLDCQWKEKKDEPTREERLRRLKDFKFSPSVVVDSGHGYHCYWLLKEPYQIKNNEDKLKMKGYTKGLTIALNGDSSFDLSRILRVPGTKNLKDPDHPLPVKIIEMDPEKKYNLKDFQEFWVKVEDVAIATEINAEEIPERFWQILTDDAKLNATWEGKREDLNKKKDHSRSVYDFALANLLMPYEFSDSEVAAILQTAPSGKGKEAKKQYLALTIGKARKKWEKRKPLELEDVLKTFKKWLELEETDYIEVIIATIISNKILGDPVWLFVIGPPGGSKTEILRSFNRLGNRIYSTSKLTAQSLISGKKSSAKYDPSLLPKLDGKTLIIKDFTSILGIQREARQTIFSDLREAYDGYLEKEFGNFGHKGFKAHFSLIANVTPVIDRYSSVQQDLGERFLKIRLTYSEMDSKILKAMDNEAVQEKMREELISTVIQFFNKDFQIDNIEFSEETKIKIMNLAKFVAIGRTTVNRDQFRGNILTYLPEYEIGTRIGIQLKKIGRSLACIREKKEVGEEEYKILRRIAQDSLPRKRRVLLEFLYQNNFKWLTTSEVGKEIRIERHTCLLALQDLQVLKLVETEKEEHKAGTPWSWKLTKEMNDLFIKIE